MFDIDTYFISQQYSSKATTRTKTITESYMTCAVFVDGTEMDVADSSAEHLMQQFDMNSSDTVIGIIQWYDMKRMVDGYAKVTGIAFLNKQKFLKAYHSHDCKELTDLVATMQFRPNEIEYKTPVLHSEFQIAEMLVAKNLTSMYTLKPELCQLQRNPNPTCFYYNVDSDDFDDAYNCVMNVLNAVVENTEKYAALKDNRTRINRNMFVDYTPTKFMNAHYQELRNVRETFNVAANTFDDYIDNSVKGITGHQYVSSSIYTDKFKNYMR